MTEKTLTTENIKPALDALRGELAPWPVVAMKQDKLNDTQKSAVNSGITSGLVAQIIANTAAIRALESAITGTGLRALVVSSLPAVGTLGILYIVPVTTYDPATDADVVNYSNEYIWIVAPDAPVTEGYYEQVGQTGIVINNGQLTITVNGTSVGTFTANQSGDTTAAITVPTNADYVDLSTSQTVTGGKTWTGEQSFTLPIVGSITGTASKAIADEDGTSIKTGYVNVAGNQTVSGDKSFTGSNAFNNILPNATNTYALGSSSYQWSSVYAQTYYYNGTQWGLDKANTWTGNNTFTSTITTKTNVDRTVAPSSDTTYGTIICRDKNNSAMFRMQGTIKTDLSNVWDMMMVAPNASYITFFKYTISSSSSDRELRLKVTSVVPDDNSTADLGTSTNQWKSVYAQSYYYNGTAWGLDKANTWSGENTYTNTLLTLKQTGLETGVTPATNQTRRYRFIDKNSEDLGWVQHRVNTSGESYIELYAVNKFDNSQLSPQGTAVANSFAIGLKRDGTRFASIMSDLYPAATNTYNLGTSTNKWKFLNGVNPGALSLPSSSYVEIDTTNWDLTGATSQSYTPTVHGWLYISIQNIAGNYLSVVGTRGAVSMDGTGVQAGLRAMLPVVANGSVSITVKTGSIFVARFYPSLGNV